MVRQRAINYDQRRQKILEGAASMFAEHGFDGTSIAAIAKYLGVSKALLYHYYQSKEALLFDMLHSHCRLLAATAAAAVKEGDDPGRQLQLLVRSLMRLYVNSRDKHVVLLNNLHCLPAGQQKQIKNLEKTVLDIIKELLRKLRPDLKGQSISALAMYLMGAVNWTYTWFKTEGPLAEGDYADLATATFLNGVSGKLPAF